MAIPDLGGPQNYWLPPGTHPCTLDEIEERFVYNKRREQLWRAFRVLLNRIKTLGGEIDVLYVDGSFVTGRREPQDIDAVTLLLPEKAKAMINRSPEWKSLQQILSNAGMVRAMYPVHLFFAETQSDVDDVCVFFCTREGRKRTPVPPSRPRPVRTRCA